MMRFRKTPVEVDAVQWLGLDTELFTFVIRNHLNPDHVVVQGNVAIVETPNGPVVVRINDWIVCGPTGLLAAYKDPQFAAEHAPCE